MSEPWLTPRDLADRYRVPLKTIYEWNLKGTAPTPHRFGKHVRYNPVEVVRWEAAKGRQEAA